MLNDLSFRCIYTLWIYMVRSFQLKFEFNENFTSQHPAIFTSIKFINMTLDVFCTFIGKLERLPIPYR